ncbi:hypothetical protein [Moraxella caviae]|nr:hypothetical protein [Moraxella caviae]
MQAAIQNIGFDAFAYLDCMFYLEEFLKDGSIHFRDIQKGDMGKTGLFYQQNPTSFDEKAQQHIAHDGVFVLAMAISGENYATFSRLFGYHNTLSKDYELYKEDTLTLLLPFDFAVTIDAQHMPATPVICDGETPHMLYQYFGDISLFKSTLTPAPVAGLVANDELPYALGYVPHPDILAHTLFNQGLIDAQKITFDNARETLKVSNTLALQMLKNRYHIPISQEYIDRLQKTEDQMYELEKQGKPIVVEI